MQLIQCLEVVHRVFCVQFFETAKPIPHRCGVEAVVAGADQVVFAVADHQGIGRVEAFFGQEVGDEFDFVGAGAVQFAAVDHFEVPGEVEVAGDFPGENPGFGGGDVELPALAAEGFQQGHDAVKYAVFVEAGDFEAFAIEVHRFPGFRFVEVIELHEGLQQRRADEVFEAGEVGFIDAQFAQGELDRTGDALARVGKRAVEVEEYGLVVHGWS